jgi:hypothetical protein
MGWDFYLNEWSKVFQLAIFFKPEWDFKEFTDTPHRFIRVIAERIIFLPHLI